MKTSLMPALVLLAVLSGTVTRGIDQSIFENPSSAIPESPIDRLLYAKLAPLGVEPALCSDAVFVRRAYLDMTGTLPTAKEAREFIEDREPNKRRALIDRLMEREEFADYWAMKWSDLLRVKAEFPINLWPNAAQAYHHWIRASIAENKPYDRFVRELLTSSGSNFRVPPVNFYRAMQNREPEGIATTVALTFMGSRAEFWPKHYLPGMKAFFSEIGYKSTSEWKEEIVFWDRYKAAAQTTNTVPRQAVFPDGTQIELPANRDPRVVFADWLIRPENRWFTLNIVNRAWAWLLGRGVIHEPDDIRPDNPPSNQALLDYLKQEFVKSRYDLRHIYRLILNSRAYQASFIPNPKLSAGQTPFASYPLRRLEAEVLIDALCQITGTKELYTSAIPEPFTFIPDGQRAVSLPDGSITSPFLELFGRPPRDTGMEAERSNRPVPAQRLHLLNSSQILRKLDDGPKLKELRESKLGWREKIEELYLTVLSRLPTEEDLKTVSAYGRPPGSQFDTAQAGRAKAKPKRPEPNPFSDRNAWLDLVWALVNSTEFLYRH